MHSKLLRYISRNRYRLPVSISRSIDALNEMVRKQYIEKRKSSLMKSRPPKLPPSAVVAEAGSRVLVAPANYAGQGYAWAEAINKNMDNTVAANLTIRSEVDFAFSSFASVPRDMQQHSREWQVREAAHIISTFTHVLIEAEMAIFGSLFENNPERERKFLNDRGVNTAYVCHGSDIRSPKRHVQTTQYSPFADSRAYNDHIQRLVDRNRAFLKRADSTVFLSTPDLINDFPSGIWLPVVVDVSKWVQPSALSDSNARERELRPLVIHTPSKQLVKGSHLIEDQVARLVDRGKIRYRSVTGVSSSEVRRMVLGADIVLDQFRLGSYGVAACEAMAAGKTVVGHVTAEVRHYIREQTGLELPIVEANPETLTDTLSNLANDPARVLELGIRGREFVETVHDGRFSAKVLQHHWLRS